ncbi:MAG: peptide deformylase, partial [Micromonosporaceae bacterium]|nr:peptide deformylase [Micromonosporaceae bacterium]
DDLAHLVEDMFASMYAARGVGLAANQIGVALRVFVYDCPDASGERHVGHLINPVLEPASPFAGMVADSEGCLSVPGPRANLPRPGVATAAGFDLKGNPITVSGTGTFARCLQHETDHLNGIVYVDRLPPERRGEILAEADLPRA